MGMSMCVLGMSSEFKDQGVAFNALWPRTPISTSALLMIPGGDLGGTRKEASMADAAMWVLAQPSTCTGNFFIDEEVHQTNGMSMEDIGRKYNDSGDGEAEVASDFFVGEPLMYFTEFTKSKL